MAETKALRRHSACRCPALQAGTEYADGKDGLNGSDGADELDNMGSLLHRRPKKYWPFSEGPRLVPACYVIGGPSAWFLRGANALAISVWHGHMYRLLPEQSILRHTCQAWTALLRYRQLPSSCLTGAVMRSPAEPA